MVLNEVRHLGPGEGEVFADMYGSKAFHGRKTANQRSVKHEAVNGEKVELVDLETRRSAAAPHK